MPAALRFSFRRGIRGEPRIVMTTVSTVRLFELPINREAALGEVVTSDKLATLQNELESCLSRFPVHIIHDDVSANLQLRKPVDDIARRRPFGVIRIDVNHVHVLSLIHI